jgi:hypothetical protein
MRVWHILWLQRIDAKIAALQKRQDEQEHGRRSRPRPPEWIVELGIEDGRPPIEVHIGDCHMAGHRRRPVSREEARRLLAAGLRACVHCQPDTLLHILDLLIVSECRPAETLAAHGTIPSATGSGGDAVWNGLGLRETSCSVTSML